MKRIAAVTHTIMGLLAKRCILIRGCMKRISNLKCLFGNIPEVVARIAVTNIFKD